MDENNVQKISRKRRYRIGAFAIVTTIVIVIAVFAVNYLIDYLADRYMLEWDMTNSDLYEIGDGTTQYLANLSEPITITVMAAEIDYENHETYYQIREVLRKYEILSGGNVTVQYVDPYLNPQLYEKYNALGDLSSYDLVVESSKRYKLLSPSDLLELYTDSDSNRTYIVGLDAEEALTGAIVYVLADKVPMAAFIRGHGENTSLDELSDLMERSNYEVETISIMAEADEIPETCELLIISEPQSDYTSGEIQKIDDFLSDGGRMMVLFAANTPYLRNLETYFQEWGVRYEQSVVLDTYQCLSGYFTYLLPTVYTYSGITDNLQRGYVIVPLARPITRLYEQDDWRTTNVMMVSSDYSYAKDLSQEIDTYDQTEEDAAGPFNITMLMSMEYMDTNLVQQTTYVLFANAGMVSDSVLEEDAFVNSDYMLQFLNYINTESDSVIIDAKTYQSTTMTIAGWQARVLFWVLIILIPLGTLAIGFGVWAKRRHL